MEVASNKMDHFHFRPSSEFCDKLSIRYHISIILKSMRALVLSSFGAFMFGWHVHEKAILLVIVPYTVLSFLDAADAALLSLTSKGASRHDVHIGWGLGGHGKADIVS